MTPLQQFRHVLERSGHLIDLYHLLHNRRRRRSRKDWNDRFKRFMNWNVKDEILRVDGSGAILVVRNQPEFTMAHFEHEWLGELLRAALVSGVSGFDHYMHALLRHYVLRALKKNPPKELRDFRIPLVAAHQAVLRGKARPKSRPGTRLRDAFSEELEEMTIQGPRQVERALAILGISRCWRLLEKRMGTKADSIKGTLAGICKRRNQIVHEGDIVPKSGRQRVRLNTISERDVRRSLSFLEDLASALDGIVKERFESRSSVTTGFQG